VDPTGDAAVVAALRAGDEQAFAALLDRYHATMLRVARGYVATREAAEDVVQETWLGVINGIDGFEGRSSLKTWIFRILVNRAKTRGEREGRTRPFSSVVPDDGEPSVDPERFIDSGRWAGFWAAPPAHHSIPEARVLAGEAGQQLAHAVDELPDNQRLVISLRDIQGLTAPEVCELLSISEANQRVLLHRARSKVRAVLEGYLDDRVVV
jgi:RNA polymerase sigma-70 factor (ECF subfamily)